MASPWYNPNFGRSVLGGLGVKPTPEKMRFLQAWAQAEGTKAQYNPFATTRKGYEGETNFNSVGVKNYQNQQQGIKATIDTLSLGYYTHIVDLLRSNDVTAEQLAAAVADSPWGTGAGVLRVLGVTQSDGYEKTRSTAQYGAKKGSIEQTYQTLTLDRFRPSESYMKTLQGLGAAGAPALRLASTFQPFTVRQPVAGAGSPVGGAEVTPGSPGGFTPKGNIYVLPTSWKGTHVTDNLDLNAGVKSATDIMLGPGTPLGAPEAGTIIRHGSAQGGSALYFRAASGALYWMGHIEGMLPVGTKVKRGQVIAYVSPDHAAPHVHIDRQPGRKKRGRK